MGDDTNSWCSLGFAEPSAAYTSATQQARPLTEGWMAGHGVRPACPTDRVPLAPNNRGACHPGHREAVIRDARPQTILLPEAA